MPLGVEAFTCLRQFLTYLAVTITLDIMFSCVISKDNVSK